MILITGKNEDELHSGLVVKVLVLLCLVLRIFRFLHQKRTVIGCGLPCCHVGVPTSAQERCTQDPSRAPLDVSNDWVEFITRHKIPTSEHRAIFPFATNSDSCDITPSCGCMLKNIYRKEFPHLQKSLVDHLL